MINSTIALTGAQKEPKEKILIKYQVPNPNIQKMAIMICKLSTQIKINSPINMKIHIGATANQETTDQATADQVTTNQTIIN